MKIERRYHDEDGTFDLYVNDELELAGESAQVIDNIIESLRTHKYGIFNYSEADEIADAILLTS